MASYIRLKPAVLGHFDHGFALVCAQEPPLLLKFHKPFDVISSMEDEKNRKDLSDALPGQRAPWDEDAAPRMA